MSTEAPGFIPGPRAAGPQSVRAGWQPAVLVLKAVLLVAFITFFPRPASADEAQSITVGYRPAWYVLGGATGGASFGTIRNSGFVGAEISVARLLGGWWQGLYADLYYDFAADGAVMSLGPEVGWWFFGVDGGAGVRTTGGGLDLGPQVRALFTLGLVSFYYRHSFWPHATTNRTVRQAGVLVKFPLGMPWGMGPSAPWDMGRRRKP